METIFAAPAGLTTVLTAAMVAEPGGSTVHSLRGPTAHVLTSPVQQAMDIAVSSAPIATPLPGGAVSALTSSCRKRLRNQSPTVKPITVDTSKLPREEVSPTIRDE